MFSSDIFWTGPIKTYLRTGSLLSSSSFFFLSVFISLPTNTQEVTNTAYFTVAIVINILDITKQIRLDTPSR